MKTMNRLSLIKEMTDALIKAEKPDTSCAGACYVGREYSSAFVVASVFFVASRFYRRKLFVEAFVRCSIPHCICAGIMMYSAFMCNITVIIKIP